MTELLLELRGVRAAYDQIEVLQDFQKQQGDQP